MSRKVFTSKFSSRRTLMLASLFLGSTALSSAAYAQAEEVGQNEEAEDDAFNGITVTANRREQSLQDVAISVVALGEEELAKKQIVDLASIELNAPSFNFEQNALKARPAIRGFGGDPLAPGQEFLSGIFLDGIYQSTAAFASIDAVDVGRVEVLRGPQGTLYGKNVVGGAVNIIPNKPVDGFEASVKATIGNFGRRDFEGVLNLSTGPINHRLVAFTRDSSGSSVNPNTDTRLADINRTGVRYSLAADITDNLTWDFTFDATTDDQAGRNVIIRGDTRTPGNPPDEASIFDFLAAQTGQNVESSDDFTVFNDDNGFARRDVFGFRSELNWSNDTFGIVYLAAYREIEDAFFDEGRQFSNQQVADAIVFLQNPDDAVRGPFDQLQPNGSFATNSSIAGQPPGFLNLGDDAEANQWSHEVRISNAGISDDVVTWTVGGFASRESGVNAFLLGIDNFSTPLAVDPGFDLSTCTEVITANDGTPVCFSRLNLIRSADNVTNDLAFFGDVTWRVTDTLNLTGGLRWTTNEKDFTQTNFVNGGFAGTGDADIRNSDVTWRLVADFKVTPDILLYASAATGFAPAGIPSVPVGAVGQLGTPDANVTSQSFEFGWKANLFEDYTRLNVNFFRSDFEGLSATQFNGVEGVVATSE